MKDKLFQIFFCFYIFWNAILCTFLSARGISMENSIMRNMCFVIALMSWGFFMTFKHNKQDKRIVLSLLVFGILFYSTIFFYSEGNFAGFTGQFLRWASDCVAGCLVGMMFVKLRSYELVHRILPFEVLALSPFLVTTTLAMGVDTGQMHDEGGYNYQSMSYTCAVLSCFCMYYAFFLRSHNSFVVRLLMAIAIIILAVTCAMTGGRGGLVLLCVYAVGMAMYALKLKLISKSKLVILAVIAVFGFMTIADSFGLWTSSGFERSSGFADDDDRWLLWSNVWHNVEDHNYLGWGIGGDYFTDYGFYTHNILLDWILELGIVGLLIMIRIYVSMAKKLFLLSRQNKTYIIILMLFVYVLVMNFFSGYWLTQNIHWLVFGVTMSAMTLNNNSTQNTIVGYNK